jgi:hypothetical protein
MRLPSLILATAALAAATPAAASADTLLAPAPGAVNLAAGGGYHAWFAPAEDTGWQLVVRAPDGTVAPAKVGGFAGPVQASIGSQVDRQLERTLVVTYGRSNGDLYAYDVRAQKETKLTRLSSSRYEEFAPAVSLGSYVFVRRGGERPGVYFSSRGASIRRVSADTPADLAFNGTRVAYTKGNRVIVRRVSGRGRALTFPTSSRPSSPVMTRYRVAWLQRDGGRVFETPRIAGSGGPYHVTDANEARRALPGAQSIAMARTQQAGIFLDAEGLKQADPPLFSTSGT